MIKTKTYSALCAGMGTVVLLLLNTSETGNSPHLEESISFSAAHKDTTNFAGIFESLDR